MGAPFVVEDPSATGVHVIDLIKRLGAYHCVPHIEVHGSESTAPVLSLEQTDCTFYGVGDGVGGAVGLLGVSL